MQQLLPTCQPGTPPSPEEGSRWPAALPASQRGCKPTAHVAGEAKSRGSLHQLSNWGGGAFPAAHVFPLEAAGLPPQYDSNE